MLGLLVNLVPFSRLAPDLIVAYGMYYGLIEVTGRPGLPAPGRTWQVPGKWVDKVPRWRRTLVWGSLLGPGFLTRNPYAGFGLLPLVVASFGNLRVGIVIAAMVGLLHGTGRALALLRDVRGIASADYMQSLIRSMRWRTFDGLALLALTGLALMMVALRT